MTERKYLSVEEVEKMEPVVDDDDPTGKVRLSLLKLMREGKIKAFCDGKDGEIRYEMS